jgi:hypothetical protein
MGLADIFLCMFLVFLCFLNQARCETRNYHMAAVGIKWDYAPSGYNQLNGKPLDEDRYNSYTMSI